MTLLADNMEGQEALTLSCSEVTLLAFSLNSSWSLSSVAKPCCFILSRVVSSGLVYVPALKNRSEFENAF